jgi:hypothetical protein
MLIVFPTFIGQMTGIAYMRVGVRKVWLTLIDNQTVSIPRNRFPTVLPDGNDLAFKAASILNDGPAV